MIYKVLTIAGSDSSGGAGIQADIKTITMHGMYAMSVITALTAQNTTGVSAILEATPEFVDAQLDAVFSDIRPDAVKIGMVSSPELISVITAALKRHNAKHIVADPVMVSTSGSRLLREDAEKCLIAELLPLAEVITPNIPEAEMLSGMKITAPSEIEAAAEQISRKIGTYVLLKGGHGIQDANDYLFSGTGKWFDGERINNPNTHGTGCTLSSAIACGLARGESLEGAVASAKAYLTGALRAGIRENFSLGQGSGPLLHNYELLTAR